MGGVRSNNLHLQSFLIKQITLLGGERAGDDKPKQQNEIITEVSDGCPEPNDVNHQNVNI